jgi:hypothetical protein
MVQHAARIANIRVRSESGRTVLLVLFSDEHGSLIRQTPDRGLAGVCAAAQGYYPLCNVTLLGSPIGGV